MYEYYNFPCFNPTCFNGAKIKHYVGIMQQVYFNYVLATYQEKLYQTRIIIFNTFKNDHTHSSYLGLTQQTNQKTRRKKITSEITNSKD